MFKSDKVLMEKWAPVLNHEGEAPLSAEKASVVARLLENTEQDQIQQAQQSTFSISEGVGDTNQLSTAVANPDPVLISLVRRAMPNLIAYDVAGVQPMSGPTGLIFAMKSRGGVTNAVGTDDTEILGLDEADTDFSGTGTHVATTGVISVANATAAKSVPNGAIVQVVVATGTSEAQWNTFTGTSDGIPAAGAILTKAADSAGTGTVVVIGTTGTGIQTDTAEIAAPLEAGFTVEKVSVTAKTRQLQSSYTMELAQDLKAVHGLDAEAELANILSTEILAEINREVIRGINTTAKVGETSTIKGFLDLGSTATQVADSGLGRWAAERFKYLGYQLEKEANVIAKETRRGKGNYIICSSSVAAALNAGGTLAYGTGGPGSSGLNIDNAGNTFAGTLSNGMKVYVDPYANHDYATVGYKGSNTFDAGLFYCPYVPLTMIKAQDESSFQPKIAFKTRYGIVANPFADSAGAISDQTGVSGVNPYFRRLVISGV